MKIFGIGLSKTGTTSLASALELLGYQTKDYPGLAHYAPGDLSSIDPALLEDYDALTDTPIPSFYRELDARYPDAKFILTVRDTEGWLKSCKKQFTQKLADKQNEAHNRLFMDLYDTTVFDEAKFRAGYEHFVKGVQDHFRDRPGKLLVLNVTGGDGWEALCAFLGKPVPDMPFPKANVTQIRWMSPENLVSIAIDAARELVRTHAPLAPSPQAARGGVLDCLARTVLALRGGRPAALARATRASEAVLMRELKKLNPDIPVVSRLAHDVPHAAHSHWNHFWLVDPLDGEEAFATDAGEFTVNIALIEDQRPVAGVVCAPLSGTVFFAMAWKGAYKVEGRNPPVKLEIRDGDVPALNHQRPTSRVAGSRALQMCLLAESEAAIATSIVDTMEWHSAAAHAVANSLGKKVLRCDSKVELSYNKKNWANPCISVA